jgi:oligopeptide transport system substrate-binding protein
VDGDPGDRERGLLQDAGKPIPLSEEIRFSTIREAPPAWNLFTQGYQDVYTLQQENFAKAISRAGGLSPDMEAKGMKLFTAIGVDVYYYGFNMRDPVVGGYTEKKRKLRQAISLAVDTQQFIDLFSQGHGKEGQFVIPPGIAGYDPEFSNPYRANDLSLAKKLLAEAGYPNGIDPKTGDRLSINYENPATTASERQMVQLAIKQLARIGVNLVSRSFRDVVWQDKLDKGEFQFYFYGWMADYPDPENFLFLLYGPNLRPGPNATAYNNPEYNRLFEQMRAMDDGPERLALIKRMREIAVEDCPLIYREHTEDLFLTQPWIRNVKPHAMANDSMKYRGVDGPMRARLQKEWNKPILWPAIVLIALVIAGSIPAAAVVNRRRNRRLRRSG